MKKRDFSGVTARNPVRAVHNARFEGNVTIQRGVSPGVHRNRIRTATTKLETEETVPSMQPGLGGVGSGILAAANRFPFSSTPTGSPTQGNTIPSKDLNKSSNKVNSSVKENTKKPINNHRGKAMNPPVTMSKVNFDETNLSDTISPIRGNRRNREVIVTQQQIMKDRGIAADDRNDVSLLVPSQNMFPNPVNLMETQLSSTWISENSEKNHDKPVDATKLPFPFPVMSNFDSLDRDTMIVSNLRLLKMYRYVKVENDKLIEIRRSGNTFGKGLKKKKSENIPSFVFTRGMFSAHNTTAFIHAYHLLFECYNPHECEIEFRDAFAWPVLEKKVESAFRRVSLKLLKNMLQAHPEYFVHTKPEALVGLISKPGGDRFIQLTESVIEVVLSRVISEMGGSSLPIIEKPKYSMDPEITNRQVLHLRKTTQCLVSRSYEILERSNRDDCSLNNKLSLFANREADWVSYEDNLVLSAEELLSEVQNQIGSEVELNNEVEDSWFKDLGSMLKKVNQENLDMNIGIEKLLLNCAAESSNTIKNLEGVLLDFRLLKFILGMDRSKRHTIDGNKLYFHPVDDNPATLANFYNCVSTVVDSVLADRYLNGPTDKNILTEFKNIDLKFQYLKLIEQEMRKADNPDLELEPLRQDLDSTLNVLKAKLAGIDWSYYSKVYDEKLTNLLGGNCLLNQVDFQRQTGLTPGITKFLSVRTVQCSSDVTDGNESVAYHSSVLSQRSSHTAKVHNESCKLVQKYFHSECQVSQASQYYIENGTPTTSRNKNKLHKQRVSFVDKLELNTAEVRPEADNLVPAYSLHIENNSSFTPGDATLSASAQSRLNHIRNSLKENSPRRFTDSRHSMDEDTVDGEAVHRRRSARLSRLSITSRTSDTNRSLLDDWSQEKGIMDMDMDENQFAFEELSDDEL